jgi:hypothetical protein
MCEGWGKRMKMFIDTNRVMAALGKTYEGLYKLPVLGNPLVRGINRGIARMIFNGPLIRRKRHETIESFKADFMRLIDMMKVPIEIIKGTEGPDGFEFYVHSCPYGFHRRDQQGVCDAAMDMDRLIFRLMGAELEIKESVVKGAPKCRMRMHKI